VPVSRHGTVDVWFIDCDSTPLPDGGECLDDQERATAARFLRPGLADRYRAAHCVLRHLLGRFTGVAAAELRFDRRCAHCADPRHGKPRVRGRDVEFSLSHSEQLAAVAISTGRPVGVDVERIRDGDQLVTLLGVSDDGDPADFTGWALREAVSKAAGLGLVVNPVLTPIGDGQWTAAPLVEGGSGWWARTLPAPDGFRAAVAADGPVPVRLRNPPGAAVSRPAPA
jgi:4'-phosphopantetheinyl transferase